MKKKQRKYRDVAGHAAKVSELKAGLSSYLERVKRGGQVVITERGRSIAKIIPIPAAETSEQERMQELERQGRIEIHGNGRTPPEFWALEVPEDPDGLVLKGLLEERDAHR